MIQNDKYNLVKRLSQFRDSVSGDTCLHIAAKSSNQKLVKFLLENNIIDANIVNNKKENALTSVLANNSDDEAESIGYLLASIYRNYSEYTNLTHKNSKGQRAF